MITYGWWRVKKILNAERRFLRLYDPLRDDRLLADGEETPEVFLAHHGGSAGAASVRDAEEREDAGGEDVTEVLRVGECSRSLSRFVAACCRRRNTDHVGAASFPPDHRMLKSLVSTEMFNQ